MQNPNSRANLELGKFKKGQSGNPSGKPKGFLTKEKVMNILGKLSAMTRDELSQLIKNPKSDMLHIMVASVMVEAAKKGDQVRLDFLWNRSIGKVKEQVEHSGEINQPQVVITLPDNGRDK